MGISQRNEYFLAEEIQAPDFEFVCQVQGQCG
jgi:hypothetical protein